MKKILIILGLLLLHGCNNEYQEKVMQLKVGDKFANQCAIFIESNEKWDKYVYKYQSWDDAASIYYTVGKDGKILSIWRKK